MEAGTNLSYREMWKISNNLAYYRSKIIGSPIGSGVVTFEGRMDGDLLVAVKRIQLVDIKTQNLPKFRNDFIKRSFQHPNILQYFQCETNEDFLFIAMELCSWTLEDYVKGNCKECTSVNEKDILVQVTEGLNFLHENRIVHGNIKPTNILFVSSPASSSSTHNKPTIKLGDYCIRRTLMIEKEQKDRFFPLNMENVISKKNNASSSSIPIFDESMNKGCWIPPESFQPGDDDDNNFKMDIFSLGLVFFYTLTLRGNHPFGETPLDQLIRIQKKELTIYLKKEDLKNCDGVGNEEVELISTMCSINPRERPTVKKVLSVMKRDDEASSSQKITDDGKTKGKKGWGQIPDSIKSGAGSSRRAYPQKEIHAPVIYSLSPRKSPRNSRAVPY